MTDILIGRDIEWTGIVRHVFRVLEFDRAGTIIGPGDNVKAASSFKPYGYLLVESPFFDNEPVVRLPIVHRDDFLLAASVFDEPSVVELVENRGTELLVTYVPKPKLPEVLARMSRALHYVLTPPGAVRWFYEVDSGVHLTIPAPEKLFGVLEWGDEIRVQINQRPEVFPEDYDPWTERNIAAAWEALSGRKSRIHWGISREFCQALVDEFGSLDYVIEPIKNRMGEAAVDKMFDFIAATKTLTQEDKAVADFALLGALEGAIPSQRGLNCLQVIFGDRIIESIQRMRQPPPSR